jgi:hypothetical protein
MAKDKLTEAPPKTRCQQLVDQVHTEERVKLEERFKEAVRNQRAILSVNRGRLKAKEAEVLQAQRNVLDMKEKLKALESADLDQWGKDNPEQSVHIGIDFGGRGCGKMSAMRSYIDQYTGKLNHEFIPWTEFYQIPDLSV